jgi:UMF1 family MFS transporter
MLFVTTLINAGLVTLGEFYVYAVVYGFNVGSVQSFSRTLFADLIPSGKEAEFFGLYGVIIKSIQEMCSRFILVFVFVFQTK